MYRPIRMVSVYRSFNRESRRSCVAPNGRECERDPRGGGGRVGMRGRSSSGEDRPGLRARRTLL